MEVRLSWRLTALLLLASGTWAGAQAARDDAAGPGCGGLTVTAVPSKISAQPGFSARDVLDLRFRLQLGQDTPTQVEMRYFTPAGHLYQSVLVPVAPEGRREQERALPGYPFPVKVAQVEIGGARAAGGDGARFVTLPALPVAGTMITQSSLYGTWRAEAWVAGAEAPCTLGFTIRP